MFISMSYSISLDFDIFSLICLNSFLAVIQTSCIFISYLSTSLFRSCYCLIFLFLFLMSIFKRLHNFSAFWNFYSHFCLFFGVLLFLCILELCECTAEYNKTIDGVFVGAFCDVRDSDAPWCYLTGGVEGRRCAGASKSRYGDFYWTKDEDICRAAESNRKSSK